MKNDPTKANLAPTWPPTWPLRPAKSGIRITLLAIFQFSAKLALDALLGGSWRGLGEVLSGLGRGFGGSWEVLGGVLGGFGGLLASKICLILGISGYLEYLGYLGYLRYLR